MRNLRAERLWEFYIVFVNMLTATGGGVKSNNKPAPRAGMRYPFNVALY